MNFKLSSLAWCFLLSVPIILALSAGLHFLYVLFPNNAVAIFAPTDESVFQHLKIVYYPIVLWWLVCGFFLKKRDDTCAASRLLGCATSCLCACVLVPSLYYLFTCGFGVEHSLFLAVGLEALSVTIGQAIGLYIAVNSEPKKLCVIIFATLLVGFAFVLGALTFYPPNLPIFIV